MLKCFLPFFLILPIAISTFAQRPLGKVSLGTDFLAKKVTTPLGSGLGLPLNCGMQLPLEFSWKDYGIVSPVKDQGNCGSCWAFAVTSVYESKLPMKGILSNGSLIQISEQEQISCNYWPDVLGCCGGPISALQWWDISLPFGQAVPKLLSTSGYTDFNTFCQFNNGQYYPESMTDCGLLGEDPGGKLPYTYGYYTLSITDAERDYVKQSIYWDGPMAVGLTIWDNDYNDENELPIQSWWSSTSGKAEKKDQSVFKQICIRSTDIGHAVTLIGWSDSKKAWLAKNSWGTGGPNMDGTFWIAYNGHKLNGQEGNIFTGGANTGVVAGNCWVVQMSSPTVTSGKIYRYNDYNGFFYMVSGSARVVAGDPRGRIFIVDCAEKTSWHRYPTYVGSYAAMGWKKISDYTMLDISSATCPSQTWVYAVATNNTLKTLNSNGTNWNDVSTTYNGSTIPVKKVDVNSTGVVYIVSTSGQVYRRLNSSPTWNLLSGISASDIGAGSDFELNSVVMVCDQNKNLYSYNIANNSWVNENMSNVVAVDVSINKEVLVVLADGSFYRRLNGGNWENKAGAGSKLVEVGACSWR